MLSFNCKYLYCKCKNTKTLHAYKNFLAYNLKSGKSQQQLFGTGIAELDGRFGIVAGALYLFHFTDAEAVVLYELSHLKRCSGVTTVACRWCYA